MSLTLLTVAADLLRANPWNTNVVTPENEQKIEESIKRFDGLFKPLVVRELDGGIYEILGGEHRWRVAVRMGYTVVPIASVGVISDAQAKEIGLVDNARYGDDDALRLAELLKGLGDVEDLQSFLPMSTDDIASIFASSTVALDDLDLLDAGEGSGPEAPKERAAPTHQLMRFKVPVGDVERISEQINVVMKRQGFTGDDSMMNAGHALVFMLSQGASGA